MSNTIHYYILLLELYLLHKYKVYEVSRTRKIYKMYFTT